jgi:hypothetical protein
LFDILEKKFPIFLDANIEKPKSEFFIPLITGEFVKEGMGNVKVIPTSGKWFGVTYIEDAPIVKESVSKLVADKEYPENLWA